MPHFGLAGAVAGQDRLDQARVAIAGAGRVKLDLSRPVIGRLLVDIHPQYLERSIGLLAKAGGPECASAANSRPNSLPIGPATASPRRGQTRLSEVCNGSERRLLGVVGA